MQRSLQSPSVLGPSQIPLPRFVSTARLAPNGTTLEYANGENGNSEAARWRYKFEEAEKARKALLTKSEKCARALTDLERKHQQLSDEHTLTKHELRDKDAQLLSLRNVSEKVYKEYDMLKNQYDVETGAMHKAMQHAGQWYKQNRQLKRQSAVLVQKYLQVKPNGTIDVDIDDSFDSTDGQDDLEALRKTVADLSLEIATLQTELNNAKLQEFEATEQCVNLAQELEQEKKLRAQCNAELEALKESRDQLAKVSRLVADEVATLRNNAEKDREHAANMIGEAKKAIRERDVLARQSALLVGEYKNDGEEGRILKLLQEVGELKTMLEMERNDHQSQVADLLEKLEDKGVDPQIEVLEEKLKITESELENAVKRAQEAEKELSRHIEKHVADDNLKFETEIDNDVCMRRKKLETPVLPPPPPPPPVPNLNFNSNQTDIKLKSHGSAISEMAAMLDIKHGNDSVTKPAQPSGGAIDAIIKQIKGGRFQLRSTEPPKIPKPKEEPAAVKEMLNILGTLRRAKSKRLTNTVSRKYLPDVQL